jgi:hypothetical protein
MAYNELPFEILAGAATIYLGDVGAVAPLIDAVPDPDDWVDVGDTEGGVSIEIGQDTTELSTDQKIAPVKIVRTGESVTVTFALAEATLENLAKVLDDITVTVVPPAKGTAGYRKFELARGAGPMAQHALLIRGPSPYGDFNMQFVFPQAVMTGTPTFALVKDDKVVFDTEWKALYDLDAGTVCEVTAEDLAPLP